MHNSKISLAPEIKIFDAADSRKLRFAILLIFAILAAILVCWTWGGGLTDFGGDSATYLLISRLYSPYHSASHVVLAYNSQIISPPLFPLMLAIVDGSYNFLAAHLLVASFLCLSTVALFLWLRQEGLSVWMSLSVALMWCLIPANLLQVLNIWTEFPYVFFSLATVVVLSAKDSVISLKNWYWAAVFVACASLIRAAALPLCVSFLVFALIKQPRNFVRLAAIGIAPFVIWTLYNSHSDQTGGSYALQLVNMYSGDPLQKILHQFATEFAAVKSAWQSAWIGDSRSPVLAQIAMAFGCICIIGWLYRLIKLRFDAIYAGLYLLLLFVWAHPEEASRYALVAYPIFVVSGFLIVLRVAEMLRSDAFAKLFPFVMVLILVMVLAPNWILYTERYLEPVPEEISAAKHSAYWYALDSTSAIQNANFQTRLFRHLREVSKQVGPDDCIFSIKPTIVTLFTDRLSYAPPKLSVDAQSFDSGIQKCRYAYVLPFASPSYPAMLYPMERLGPRAKLISNTVDGAGQLDTGLLEITQSPATDKN
jgi:hypothetical protein